MSRRYSASETARHARAKRDSALARNELRGPSTPRVAAAGPTSLAIKVNEDADLIEAFLAERKANRP